MQNKPTVHLLTVSNNLMKKITFIIITVAFIWCSTGYAQASLIDDFVDIEHHSPFFGTVDLASGGGEQILVTDISLPLNKPEVEGMHFGVYDVNVEEASVTVDFLKLNQFGNPGVFDYAGLVVSDLDFEPGYILLGVNITTNMGRWDNSRLMFGDDFVGFNWQGLTVTDNTNFTALFDFGPNPIPIPPTLLLFVSGIAGFTLIRRKMTK
jgi:hypothetical protein